MKLKNKRIVLLGGTSGFGFATALAAAEEGAQVIVVSGKQANVDKALAALPAGTAGYAFSVTDEVAMKNFFQKIGKFDHLIFTAGESLHFNELSALDTESAKHFFDTRFWGAINAAKYAAEFIKKDGSITLTNGVVGIRPLKGWSIAASVCGAIEALTRALAIELAPIRVNAVCAGVVKTNLWNNIPENDRESFYKNTGQSLLTGRVGEATDIAQTYLYLVQQEFCTGQCLVVDGGAVLV